MVIDYESLAIGHLSQRMTIANDESPISGHPRRRCRSTALGLAVPDSKRFELQDVSVSDIATWSQDVQTARSPQTRRSLGSRPQRLARTLGSSCSSRATRPDCSGWSAENYSERRLLARPSHPTAIRRFSLTGSICRFGRPVKIADQRESSRSDWGGPTFFGVPSLESLAHRRVRRTTHTKGIVCASSFWG